MRSCCNSVGTKRNPDRPQTVEPERNRGNCQNPLFIVGIGPGSHDYLSKRACSVLKSVEIITGYTTYIELIRTLIKGKKIISSGMKKEVDRVSAAIDTVIGGKSCAIVSSGDPGVYAMAGLLFEICQKRKLSVFPLSSYDWSAKKDGIYVEVVPGIPALCSGASLLGAPLTHDFAAISLSDLLTPWSLIEKRIHAAAGSDFVIVLYNPKSKKRSFQLSRAKEIIMKYRLGNTPVGIVTGAMRKGQDVKIVKLEDLDKEQVNMQTTVFIGSSRSVKYMDFMVTPRGYADKYSNHNGFRKTHLTGI